MEHSVSYHPASTKLKKAVTLVVHGLNLKPEAMLSLVGWLSSKGSDVYMVRLSGHRQEAENLLDVSSSRWHAEMLQGYERAKQTSVSEKLPLYFLGYSLGALLAQTMMSAAGKTLFDRQVLIAPAVALRRRVYLLRMLFFAGKKRRLPSFAPPSYRVNKSLPLWIYQVLFFEVKKVAATSFIRHGLPTLILIDPKDELISFAQLVRHTAVKGMHDIRLVALNTTLAGRSSPYHHLVVDEATMGAENWEKATGEIHNFLFSS